VYLVCLSVVCCSDAPSAGLISLPHSHMHIVLTIVILHPVLTIVAYFVFSGSFPAGLVSRSVFVLSCSS